LFFFSAVIDDNEPFREWTSNRLMPVIDYFSVPLDEKKTGEDNKVDASRSSTRVCFFY
jgi:hypothetical protein